MKWTILFSTILFSLTTNLAPTLSRAADGPATVTPVAGAKLSIDVYTSDTDTFLVNSYLLETANSVVLIDTQLTRSRAKEVKEKLAKIGKPLAAIFISHPHPDHYNNIGEFLLADPQIPVYATAATQQAMREDDSKLRGVWQMYYPDYPAKLTLPTKTVKAGDTLTIDNLQLQIDEVNGGESRNQMLIYLQASKSLFIGDLVYNGIYANAREGHTKAWISNLEYVLKKYPAVDTIYPGHGKSGTPALLTTQIKYLTELRNLIRAGINLTNPQKTLPVETSENLYQTMRKNYPYVHRLLLDMSIPPILNELYEEAGVKITTEEEDEEE